MKILLVHNFYGSSAPSGENTVFFAEKNMLQSQGHQIIEFTRHSDEIRNIGAWGTIKGACSTPWNPFSKSQLRCVLKNEKPDVMHVHNTFPLLSPAIFHAAYKFKTATVLTLHNYRIFCAAGTPMRNSLPCTECLDKQSSLPALKYGCYRNNRMATLPMALMIWLHKNIGTWRNEVDALIALTEFQKNKMLSAGLPADRIFIKPHFYPEPIPNPVPWNSRESRAVFVGRLSSEKGIFTLIDAWRKWGATAPHLDIIGDGPDRRKLKSKVHASRIGGMIRFTGQLPFSEVQRRLSRSRLLILPSLCFEGFPMTIREAFALGVPVAASRLGSLPYIVTDQQNGVLFSPGDSHDMFRTLKKLWETPERMSAMAKNARKEFEEKYTSEINHGLLMGIYRSAISIRKKRKHRPYK